ncbi:MAG: M48 family metallopeptidase [Candidatus Cloacimonetes bacterium]|nr:M48 family metallopeptidase [Candidatus Cloacimonadota bacterium]
MWELIQLNKRRSLFLFGAMGAALLLLGYFIGMSFFGEDGWVLGLSIALIIWIIMSLVSYFSGDSIILTMSKAKKVSPDFNPQLYNIVEEMKIAANLPNMPDIYVISDPAPNAFATGRNPEKSSVVVTAGLLNSLNRNELQGVIAHEVSHILNRDVLYMTFSGVLLGSIVLLSHIFLRSMWFGGNRRISSRNSSRGGGNQIILLVAILFAILAPLMAQLLYFAISRKREYLADATAVRLTRYPEGLASALEKISLSTYRLESANKATAGLYIANPLNQPGKKLANLTSTHPPIQERIKILREINSGANYIDYQNAFSRIRGNRDVRTNIIPPSGIRDTAKINLKTETGLEKTEQPKDDHKLYDMMRTLNQFNFLQCTCGLKIKIPPDFKGTNVHCPRCDRFIEITHQKKPIAE